MLVEMDDTVLLGLFQNRATRNEGFKKILKKHSRAIYYFLRKLGLDHEDADEILQDVFVKFWRTTILSGSIKVTLYYLTAKYDMAYLSKNTTPHLHGLTSEELLTMILKDQEEFNFVEIAQITSIPVNEIRNHFQSGVNKINNRPNIKKLK
jgi:DNA-directed RNA polymerase specialized sigma24 family protein